MRGDFSRITFDKANRFSRVVFQQGRDLLEADFNELSSIQRHQLRELSDEAIGWWGRPSSKFLPPGSKLSPPANSSDGLVLHVDGSYYLGGLRLGFKNFPDRTVPRPSTTQYLLLFLDVYEETVYPATDPNRPDPDPNAPPSDPRALVIEPALDPRDTALRARPAWVVQAALVDRSSASGGALLNGWDSADGFRKYLAGLTGPPPLGSSPLGRARPGTGMLQAQVNPDASGTAGSCDPVTANQFQGIENQLYRVEIHNPIKFDTDNKTVISPPTFKWSRDNASVVFAVDRYVPDQQSLKVYLSQPALDQTWALQRGNWVEMVPAKPPQPDQAKDPFLDPLPLLLVTDLDPDQKTVTLALPDGFPVSSPTGKDYPLLLRWDHTINTTATGGIPVQLAADNTHPAWLSLEAGVQVQFSVGGGKDLTRFRPGDYWLIPARVASQNVIWPLDLSDPKQPPLAMPPDGPEHLYAPLAMLDGSDPLAKPADPLPIHAYPWTGLSAPVKPSAGWNINNIFVNIDNPSFLDGDPPYQDGTTDMGLKVLNDLKDPAAQVVMTYSLRQMLVIAGIDPVTDTPPNWADLLETLRRYHLEPQSHKPLARLIHDAVEGNLLTAGSVVKILKAPPENPPLPADVFGQLNASNFKNVTLGGRLPKRLNDLSLDTAPKIIKVATGNDLVTQVGNGLDPQLTQAETEALKKLWHDCSLVDYYFKAWPYRTVQLTNDKKDWQ